MNAPSEDMKDILEGTSALALTFAEDLFISEMPDENEDAIVSDQCVCIYDTGGEPAEVNYTYEKPTIQIRVRGAKGAYLATHELAQSIRDTLNGLHNETWNGARYIGIWAMGDVLFISYDDNHRPIFTVNFRIHRTEA